MSNPAPTLNQINAFNATQGTTIDFNIIGGTEVIRSNKIYIYDLSDNSLICTHLYVSTESIHELPPNTSSSIVYASGKSSADFTNNTQYYAQIQTFTDTSGTQGASGLSIAKLFWCLPTPTLTLSTIPTTISTTSYNVSATYTPNTSGSATNEIQEFQFNLYSAIGALLQTSGVVLYGEGVDLSYNFSGLEVDSTYYVTLDVTTTQGMNVSAQSNTFTVSIDTPTIGSASVVNNGCDGYISVTSSLSSEYEHEESSSGGEIMSFTTDSVNDIIELDVDFSPIQDDTPWMSAQDTEPYMFRPVPTQTEDFGHESDTIVGGTVGWNQLFPLGSDSWQIVNGSIDITATNGRLVATGTSTVTNTSSLFPSRIYNQIKPIYGHKYLLYVYGTTNFSIGFAIYGTPTKTIQIGVLNGDGSQIIACETANSTDAELVGAFTNGSSVSADFHSHFIDLTAYFGSATIADYVYTLEQGTAGAGVAWLKENAPQLFEYKSYDAGSLVSVSGLTSHDMVGFNQWDEEVESGYINVDTGQNAPDNSRYRSKNYIEVLPNTEYYFKTSDYALAHDIVHRLYYYDADKNFISSPNGWYTNHLFTTPSNAHYVRFFVNGALSGFDDTICINLSDASLNGTYKSYVKHSYPLDSDLTLRGISKLDASNNLYYDGDIYNADGSVDRRYAEIDLGTLTWVYDNNNTRFYANISDAKSTNYSTVLAVGYETSANPISTHDKDKQICVYGSGTTLRFYLTNFAYTDTTSLKNALSGVYCVYELATPTTSYADPFQSPQIVDPHGTEQYVGSPIPVGHETTYQRICPISGWDSVELEYTGVNVLGLQNRTSETLTNQQYTQVPNIGEDKYYIGFGDTLLARPSYVTNVNISSGSVSFTTVTTIGYGVSFPFRCKPNTTYFKHADTATNVNLIPVYCDASGNYIGKENNGSNNIAFTTPSNCYYVLLSVIGNAIGLCSATRLSINYPSTNHTYHAYQGTTYASTFPKYKQQVSQDKIPYITKDIGDTYADTLTENLVGGTIAWNQSVPDTTTTHTVSGSIASMDDAVAGNFESVVCDIEPFQDLHGYDKPWVGGAGKNKVNDGLKGVYGNQVFIGFDSYALATSVSCVLPAGTYTFSVETHDGTNPAALYVAEKGTQNAFAENYQKKALTFTIAQTTEVRAWAYKSGYGDVGVSAITYAQIEVGSTATAYAPYENLCPITGWTGCEVDVSGVNLADPQEILNKTGWTESGGVYSGTSTNLEGYRIELPTGTGQVAFQCEYKGETASRAGFFCFEYSDSTTGYIECIGTSWVSKSEVSASGKSVTAVTFIKSNAINMELRNIQIEIGSAVTSYTPYNGTTHSVSWQTEAGTVYGGTLDLVTGVLTVDRTMINGNDLTFNYWYDDDFYSNAVSGKTAISGKPPISECYELNNLSSGDFQKQRFYLTDVSANHDASVVNANVQGKKFVFYLATPTTYQLDPVQVACLLGQNNVWNNISDTTVTYPTNHSYQSLSTTHKYYKRINGVESISVGSDVVADVGTDNIIDLTQMFGTTIADYIYNIEQSSSSGMGVKFFKSLFPNDDYEYNSGELISVNASAHVIKDANGNVLHTYPLDSDLVLRGIPKLDANNKLYYDGDVYEPSGRVTRKYGIVDLGTLNWSMQGGYFLSNLPTAKFGGRFITVAFANADTYTWNSWQNWEDKSGALTNSQENIIFRVKHSAYSDANAFKSAINGIYMVYELATSTTESADPFEENQAIVSNGIEEYTVTEQGDVEMPIGHDSTYYATEIYGGTIDVVSGVLTINMASVGLGTLTWAKNGTRMLSQSLSPVAKNIDTSTVPNAICSQYVPKKWSEVASGNYDGTFCVTSNQILVMDSNYTDVDAFTQAMKDVQLVYELATPIEISLTPQQMQTLSGQNNVWSNTNGDMYLVYQLPITALLVKRRDVADVSGKWLTLYSTPITQADDMDFTFIDFLNQYGKTYQYALVPVLEQDQSGVIVQIEGGYTVSDNVDSIFDGVYIADQTNVERVKAGVGYGNIDMNQGVGSITPIGSKYPIVITNSQNQYHNGSIRGTIVPNDFYSNGNLSRIDMVNKRDELEQFLTNKRAKIIKDWNGKMWLVMIMSNVSCSFDDNYGMGMVSFSADWLEVGDPTNQQDLYNAGLINVGGV